MSIPESIPEDKIESYQCDYCPNGNITEDHEGNWLCDFCDIIYKPTVNNKQQENLMENNDNNAPINNEVKLEKKERKAKQKPIYITLIKSVIDGRTETLICLDKKDLSKMLTDFPQYEIQVIYKSFEISFVKETVTNITFK
jgi:hypothetical protein